MKIKKILKFLLILFVLLGVSSCKSVAFDDEFGGDVPYKSCSCGKEKSTGSKYDQKFYQGEAYMYMNGSIPEQIRNQISEEIYSPPYPIVCWIVYYSETDIAEINFYSKSGGMTCVGTICNFPDFAKKWNTAENGYKVYYEGKPYKPCSDFIGTTNNIYINYVLTSLKRK